ncbi:MAG: FHA domain-containing protein [Candidatus Pacearchaeota archaeon]|jgi:pSer/pThr/pTyr-binding forkhead associated (FHA) protein
MKHLILKDDNAGKKWDLTDLVEQHHEVTIGRLGGKARIQVGDFDQLYEMTKTEEQRVLSAKSLSTLGTVSGEHGVIKKVGDFYRYKDLNSTNGTRFNGEKTPHKGEEFDLVNRTTFYLGIYGPLECTEVDV